MNTVEYNLSTLKKEIVPYKPIIIAVTKYFDETKLIEAYEDGLRDFGENRVQDALEKIAKLPEEVKKNSRFHLIGHLQSNKVKKAVGHFETIQGVDSFRVASLISQEAVSQGISQKILLQVNNANEEGKSGFEKKELRKCFSEITKLDGVEVIGLMNIAPITSEEQLHILFEDMKSFKQELEQTFDYELKELSMGMSGDYKIALEHGATMIRIGRKLFT